VSELQKMNNFETVNGWLLRPAKDREGFAEPDEVAIGQMSLVHFSTRAHFPARKISIH
jgi:hypothetical protein